MQCHIQCSFPAKGIKVLHLTSASSCFAWVMQTESLNWPKEWDTISLSKYFYKSVLVPDPTGAEHILKREGDLKSQWS